MEMTKLINLQLFGEGGGAGASAGAGTGTSGADGTAVLGVAAQGDSVNNGENVNVTDSQMENTAKTPEERQKDFEALIKGEYKDEFAKRTQAIINERFKKMGELENTLNSHNELLSILSQKYGVNDIESLTKAMEEDESFYEAEARERGLSVQQLKEIKSLERENKYLREMAEQEERQKEADQTLARWTNESEQLVNKYGLQDFNLQSELDNPDFVRLLAGGISLESAYKAVHFDDMIGGAMAQTAKNVREQVTNNIESRNTRPTENGVSSQNAQVFKTDVNNMTKADRQALIRRAEKGENIKL